MSTRWYPIYQRGNPQLRIFLPNFWVKLVKHDTHKLPSNIVQFITSIEMTRHDIKNYLEKIYSVPVVDVKTRIVMGKTKKDKMKGYVVKEDDYKLAYITLPRGQMFQFPDLFPKDEAALEDQEKILDEAYKGYENFLERTKTNPGFPGWFA
ncbi:large ribosomal subunit protein uL23m isoform X2 [Bacillus rossius redtenbacheri]|uniref:large ribosomal subunit protein uL23m isoform X2 n=1 Tax=Bacillus rossius redtenbacheri TaxID=93214 RepID=UPI002FDD4967